ncbi:U6 snRNA phosphodiesterase Usb1 [Nemania sp. FL0916]|nr:U6 snRNA phosphodiesterase Usb1 [Nemania sp. FL0916]
MGLVDYSSDSSDPEVACSRTKRRKTSDDQTTTAATTKTELPPLPSAFHDLYASTVRLSASDDPTLHQGRKRVNPHKVGSWPSHLYIEWHPTTAERALLTTLLSTLESKLTPSSHSSPSPSPSLSSSPQIISFLTSDLGAPQPLHISLSRPIVLSTAQKDRFLADLEARIRASGIAPFILEPMALSWHRADASARSFLVLRVRGSSSSDGDNGSAQGVDIVRGKKKNKNDENGSGIGTEARRSNRNNSSSSRGGRDKGSVFKPVSVSKNQKLEALLNRANALVAGVGQPLLYAESENENGTEPETESINETRNGDENNDEEGAKDGPFHISIAWTPTVPDAELRRLTAEAFCSPLSLSLSHSNPATATPVIKDAVGAMRIRVDGIKAKIGNVVTHVPLPDARGGGRGQGGGRGIFGI